MRLEVSVFYTNGKALVLPHSHRDDPRGRKATDERAFEMLALPTVERVSVHRTRRTAAGKPPSGRKSYR
jgi:hypothetical protein